MKIRTYFWHDRVISKREFELRKLLRRKPYHHFLVGNAGDLMTIDLVRRYYGCRVINIRARGRRLLMVGSIAGRILDGDVVCGIGTKDHNVPPARESRVHVWALRGPITLEAFKAAGHDVSNVRFLLDPGLMIRYELEANERDEIEPQGEVFVPHYRERPLYIAEGAIPNRIRLVDIDDRPRNVARKILGAELVYTSSLHGIIFAHALGRPCVFVRPQTDEGLLKYEDYFASVNLPLPKPLSDIWASRTHRSPDSPAHLSYSVESFVMPTLDDLRSFGVVTA